MEDEALRRAVMVSICERSADLPECEKALMSLKDFYLLPVPLQFQE